MYESKVIIIVMGKAVRLRKIQPGRILSVREEGDEIIKISTKVVEVMVISAVVKKMNNIKHDSRVKN